MNFVDKIKSTTRSRSFLFKLISSIVVLILIPLLGMQMYLTNQSVDELQKSNQQYYESILKANSNTFTSRQQAFMQTALSISMNETVQKPLRHNANEYTLYEAALAVDSYGTEFQYVDRAGVYYASKGYLLTGGFKYDLQDYCEKAEPSDPALAQEMQLFFEELETTDYYATSDGTTLYAACPIALERAGTNDSVAFFIIDAHAMEESYRSAIAFRSSFAVLNANRDILIAGADFKDSISPDELSGLLSGGSTVCAAGEEDELLVCRYTDPETGFTFLLSLDRSQSEEQLLSFVQQVQLTMLGMLLLTLLSLAATIYINYRPLHRLLEKHVPQKENSEVFSEIERLDSAFFELDKRTSTLQELVMDFILGDLLSGTKVSPALTDQFFSEKDYRSFIVLTSQCPALPTAQSQQLAGAISKATGYHTHVTSIPNRTHMIIVCFSEAFIDPAFLSAAAASAIQSILGTEYPLCAGNVVADIHSLQESYQNAVMIDPKSMPAASNADPEEFTQKLQAFSRSVYMSNRTEALAHLESIQDFLSAQTANDGRRHYYCFKLLHSYLTSIASNKAPLDDQQTNLLLSFNDMEHLFTLLRDSVCQVCTLEQSADLQLQQKLLQYVEDNFRNSELCLTSAADHLGVSIYTVSRLFKEITGSGFKDYVTERRLAYSHMLLINTNKSIAEISAESGFENANYFSTVFKQKYGMPPSKYRSLQTGEHSK